eukprot:gene9335-19377_t
MDEMRSRPVVVITARVHPAETVASWMMQGILDFILGDSNDAKQLRKLYVFKIIPMLNPDGVINGNTRTSLSGVDLNRHWANPSESLHPTIYNTKEMIRRLKKEGVFLYGCIPDKRLLKTNTSPAHSQSQSQSQSHSYSPRHNNNNASNSNTTASNNNPSSASAAGAGSGVPPYYSTSTTTSISFENNECDGDDIDIDNESLNSRMSRQSITSLSHPSSRSSISAAVSQCGSDVQSRASSKASSRESLSASTNESSLPLLSSSSRQQQGQHQHPQQHQHQHQHQLRAIGVNLPMAAVGGNSASSSASGSASGSGGVTAATPTSRDVVSWKIKLYPRLLASLNEIINLNACSNIMLQNKSSTMRIVMFAELGIDYSYTIEASIGGNKGVHFNVRDLIGVGGTVCQSLLELYPCCAANPRPVRRFTTTTTTTGNSTPTATAAISISTALEGKIECQKYHNDNSVNDPL